MRIYIKYLEHYWHRGSTQQMLSIFIIIIMTSSSTVGWQRNLMQTPWRVFW